MRGRFITFEGIDGAGKSTHIDWVAGRLRERTTVVTTREPGGTPLGEDLRGLLLHRKMDLETEALLMFAARREHIAEVIEPALARGDWVISDRFTDATFAYQGGGRGLPRERLETLEQWVQGDLQPDLTLLFDVPLETAAQRLANAREPDKFEAESRAFFERTRAEYLRRAAEAPGRFRVIDATRSIEEIRVELEKIVASL
ncbi:MULTISPECIES: dTMP kinase [unclassified Cupriavidus]|uniref:dTMP kinase n=1 Tax=unclassified Cupriavidus TaxID=2640874 RepID=UPI001C000B77|nr:MULTISPECIES: dTMP kinase [unclassified Cupriavidus]MCA3182524.1 dTMP kinase [Cupriavidus sp.]MCA3189303.1 dTMP kinase [Cupriavidus sp.]MCA3195383.1 dTMP kinase [Cupriavidus sp.]MCA3200938.1 dTMP kinase [Cupriavidus sp.]MCA3210256.1 dTMP kinase [Cupriavidus sp.]